MSVTQIGNLKVDDPVDMSTIGTRDDRQYIDQQIRGVENHLVQSLLSGVHCTWLTVDDAQTGTVPARTGWAAVGINSNGEVTVIPAAGGGTAPYLVGLGLTAASARGKVLVAVGGCLSPVIHGLSNGGIAGFAVINTTTGLPQFVTSITSSDIVLGRVNAANVLTLVGANLGSSLIAGLAITSTGIIPTDNTTNGATATDNTFQAQNATGTTSTGGNVVLAAGTGTSRYGVVKVVGGLAPGLFTQAMADANQSLSLVNSAANIIECTGALTAARTLTVARLPATKSMFFLNNKTTGGFAINVQFALGSTFSVPAGKCAIIYGDGTNATGFTITT